MSVRLALWATAAYAGQLTVSEAIQRASPDLDHVTGDIARLDLWRDFGEQVLLVALPRPGDPTAVPRGNPDLLAAATEVGECLFVPGMGGAMVPTFEQYGPEGDQGTSVTWTAYDCDPWPRHRVEELSVNEAELRLRQEVAERTRELDAIDSKAFMAAGRDMVDQRLSQGRWGLPGGLPARAERTIALAAQVSVISEIGRTAVGHSVDSYSTRQRMAVLSALQAAADKALETAVNVSALSIAGWR